MLKQFLENLFATAVLVGTEAWFLKGYFAGQPEFESGIAFIAALGVVLAKDPIRARLSNQRPVLEHDQALFNELLRVLPAEPTIRALKEHDFGGPLRRSSIDPLYEFNTTWDNVEKEFVDPELEQGRKELHAAASDLAMEIAGRTVPNRTQDHITVYSEEQRAETRGRRPPEVIEDARVLNEKASAFVPKYEAFIRLCRRKLAR
ncbi:MAG: hypothetical protein KF892_23740 [Rhizobacter sp.]|nr:hypothetical protein [Rhizobacter sp.]